MLVQCPECNTKYNLNENQIAPEGSKVRCARCKNVFTAFRAPAEAPVPPTPASDATLADGRSGPGAEEKPAPSAPASVPSRPASAPSFEDDLEQLLAEKMGASTPAAAQAETSVDLPGAEDLDLPLTGKGEAGAADTTVAATEMSFEDELDSILAEKKDVFESNAPAAAPAAATRGISFDDELDEIFAGKQDAPAAEPAPAPAGTGADVSFEDDLDQLFAEKVSTPAATPAAPSRPAAGPAFDAELDDLFEEKKKAAPAPVSSKEEMVADLEGAFQQPLIDRSATGSMLEEEPRPAAVKKSSRFGLIVTILLLLIAATGAGIYYKFIWLPARTPEANATAPGTSAPVVPESVAQIALENVRQYFVPNEKEGQLFIIEGKAVNRFPEPKELLRLKASLYDKQGNVLTSQEFMCGNVVTLYQLQVSTRQDIEAALAAKVGILTNNTNVQPGASVPFMVVFFGAPQTVEEFGLEVVQSQSPQ